MSACNEQCVHACVCVGVPVCERRTRVVAVGGQVVSAHGNNSIMALPQICAWSGSGCSEPIMEAMPLKLEFTLMLRLHASHCGDGHKAKKPRCGRTVLNFH